MFPLLDRGTLPCLKLRGGGVWVIPSSYTISFLNPKNKKNKNCKNRAKKDFV
jgi:hypothetical protein